MSARRRAWETGCGCDAGPGKVRVLKVAGWPEILLAGGTSELRELGLGLFLTAAPGWRAWRANCLGMMDGSCEGEDNNIGKEP
jgi:hypothetical protein